MKTLRYTTLAALTALAATGVYASGTHAGGHHAEDLIGKAGVAAKATRTVKVDMTDGMRFNPASIDVKQGETVRFVVTNSGKLKHELVLGTEKELKEHYEVMKKNPEMEHADANMVTLAAGKTGEVVWQFTKAGKVDFACLQPGHYDAGMKGAVNVTKASEKPAQK
ncbi:cupredoxin domain-containing protein [Variovorax sp. LjRoot178]|uniref:cupredoxin domain-containing protein n=1 Tax=Variovorax sp. LjRoot178 TaxID=3342277 RepID=UPI003ECC31E5